MALGRRRRGGLAPHDGILRRVSDRSAARHVRPGNLRAGDGSRGFSRRGRATATGERGEGDAEQQAPATVEQVGVVEVDVDDRLGGPRRDHRARASEPSERVVGSERSSAPDGRRTLAGAASCAHAALAEVRRHLGTLVQST